MQAHSKENELSKHIESRHRRPLCADRTALAIVLRPWMRKIASQRNKKDRDHGQNNRRGECNPCSHRMFPIGCDSFVQEDDAAFGGVDGENIEDV